MQIHRIVVAAAAMLSFAAIASAEEPAAPAAPVAPVATAGAHEAAPAPPPAPEPAAKPKAAEEPEAHPHHSMTYNVGINVQKLTKLELGPGTFESDFIVTYHCTEEPCDPHIQLYNGEIKGKPDKIVDEKLLKLYRVKAELTTDVDLSGFPFDEHELNIELGDLDEGVTLTANAKDAPDPTDVKMSGWDISGGDAKITSEDVGQGLKASHYIYGVTVRRPMIAAVAKNFLPALTMVFVLFISLIMKPKMAAARLAAGTGSFVAVIMFHNTAASQLPPLGFFTLLDKFMFSLYMIWLMHIVFSVMILRAEDQKNEKLSDKVYRSALLAVPVLAVLGWGLVFSKVI